MNFCHIARLISIRVVPLLIVFITLFGFKQYIPLSCYFSLHDELVSRPTKLWGLGKAKEFFGFWKLLWLALRLFQWWILTCGASLRSDFEIEVNSSSLNLTVVRLFAWGANSYSLNWLSVTILLVSVIEVWHILKVLSWFLKVDNLDVTKPMDLGAITHTILSNAMYCALTFLAD